MPSAAVVAPVIVGFSVVDVKPFGPLQLNVPLPSPLAVKFKSSPAHIGLLLVGAGADGIAFTVTTTVPAADSQPFIVSVTL